APLVLRVRIRAEDHAALAQVLDAPIADEDRRRVACVRVEEVPVRLDLAVEQGNEAAREPASADDAVELLDPLDDLEGLIDHDPESRDHVARLERRREAVSARVHDGDAQNPFRNGQEVVEVAADLLGGNRMAPEVEPGE